MKPKNSSFLTWKLSYWRNSPVFFSYTESVIKRRLLIDGDGTGEDRRLNVLLKSFIKWSNTKDTPENT